MVPQDISGSRYVSLATFRRSGAAVATPVWAAEDEAAGALLVWTRNDSGKVKRLRNSGRVTVTPCDARGRTAEGATEHAGTARLMDDDEAKHLRQVMARKYGWQFRLVEGGGTLLRLGKRPHTGVAITF